MVNDFTYNVATLTVPEKGQDNISLLEEVDCKLQPSKSIAVLAVNGLILRAIGWLFPRPIAKHLVTTDNIQVDFSNIIGPEEKIQNFGGQLEKMVCWLPHMGTTGKIIIFNEISITFIILDILYM
jgi:hypothetical protein